MTTCAMLTWHHSDNNYEQQGQNKTFVYVYRNIWQQEVSMNFKQNGCSAATTGSNNSIKLKINILTVSTSN